MRPRLVRTLILLSLVSGCVRTETPRLEGLPDDAPALKLQIPNIQIRPKVDTSSEPSDEPPLLLPALGVDRDAYCAFMRGRSPEIA